MDFTSCRVNGTEGPEPTAPWSLMAAARVGLGAPALGCLFSTIPAHPVLALLVLTHSPLH